MQFYYDEKMPLRILDEGDFWKQQEAEHTVVIRELVRGLEPPYVEALQKWEESFASTQAEFVRMIEWVNRSGAPLPRPFREEMRRLVLFSMGQSRQFIALIRRLKSESEAIKANQTAIVVLNHIQRESDYFIGITQALMAQNLL